MALMAGTRLGAYEITGTLGAGGMGEVYRATDTKLGRELAIKTLPAALATDKDRLARFEREAKLLAALNHAHIASVYSLDEHDGTQFLAMELVEGETLEEKLKAGPVPVENALHLALQIAEALEAAHEKGVVHRDLKPANIMVTANGQVKVLDFGLAKAFSGDPDQATLAHSPALSVAMTQQGLILGTAGYMSPEQASGQATDQRADIWAFGVVLYEMLTGLPLFSGESVPHVLADVLKTNPCWNRLPKNVHPRLRFLLESCLEKKPRNRYHSIADVRVDIEAVLKDPAGVVVRGAPGGVEARASVPLHQRLMPWAAGLALAALAGGAAWTLKTEAPRPLIRSVHAFPAQRTLATPGLPSIAIAPDGRQFVYNASDGIYLHRMDSFEDVLISGSDALHVEPAFSPDGKSVAYMAGTGAAARGGLSRIPVSGGAAIRLGSAGFTATAFPYGLSWEPDGTIVYALADGIWRVSANGGEPERFIATAAGEQASEARLLPGSDWVLFSVAHGPPPYDWDAAEIVAQSLSSGERRVLHKGGSSARYVPTGHLIYAFGNTLYAAPMDLDAMELTGEPIPVVQGVLGDFADGRGAQYAFSRDGTLIYVPVGVQSTRLAIVDRSGHVQTFSVPGGEFADPRVSPDGRLAAYTAMYPDGADITVYEPGGGAAPSRVTFGGKSRFPIWSADSTRVAFQSTRDGTPSLYWQLANGNGGTPEQLTTAADGETHTPESFSPDGRHLLFTVQKGGEAAIWTLDLETKKSEPLIAAPGVIYSQPVFSPNGQWIAYQSTETGSNEIFVQPYPPTGAKRQLPHTIDNHHPVWSKDGSEILYVPGPGRFESVRVTTQPVFGFGPAEALPDLPVNVGPESRRPYDVMPDGSGFLEFVAATNDGAASANDIYIVYNWFDELKRLVPTK